MDSSTLTAVWREHWALVTGVFSALFVALRILSAAQYDPTTAYGILQAGGTASVLIGATLSAIGSLAVFIVGYGLFLYSRVLNDEKGVARNIVLCVMVASALISVAVSPVAYMAMAVFTVSALISLEYPLRKVLQEEHRIRGLLARGELDRDALEQIKAIRGRRKKLDGRMEKIQGRLDRISRFLPKTLTTNRTMVYSVVAALILFALNTTHWLPAENISVRGSKPIAGYVLGDSGDYTAILADTPRRIEYVDTSRITARQVCNNEGIPWFFESIPELLSSARYPSCKN